MIPFILPTAYLLSAIVIVIAAVVLLPHCTDAHVAKELRINAIVHVCGSLLICGAYVVVALVGTH